MKRFVGLRVLYIYSFAFDLVELGECTRIRGYPSTTSCVVAATGSDFTTILRPLFAESALGNVVLSPVPISNVSPICVLGSVSVTGLFSLSCPLPLADDAADFVRNLFMKFNSD